MYESPSKEIYDKSTQKNIKLKSTFSGLQRCRWQCGSIFTRLAVIDCHICEIPRNSRKILTYNSSKSSKVDDLVAKRKRACNFLLVIINCGRISATDFEILTHFARKKLISPIHPCLTPHIRGISWDISAIYVYNAEKWPANSMADILLAVISSVVLLVVKWYGLFTFQGKLPYDPTTAYTRTPHRVLVKTS